MTFSGVFFAVLYRKCAIYLFPVYLTLNTCHAALCTVCFSPCSKSAYPSAPTYNVFVADALRHAVALTFDSLILNVLDCIGCHVIKVGTKFERNRTIRNQWTEVRWIGASHHWRWRQGNLTCWNSKLKTLKIISTPRKINASLLNIKIHRPKLVNVCKCVWR